MCILNSHNLYVNSMFHFIPLGSIYSLYLLQLIILVPISIKIILKVPNVNFHLEIGPLLDTRCTYWMIYVTHLI